MIYRFADVAIDEDRDEIRREGEVVPAQKKVRDLLLYLIHRRDRLVSKEELFEALWPGVTVNEAALTQAVYGARRAVGDDARNPRVLETVRGRGVRFVAPVKIIARTDNGPVASARAGPSIPFVGRDGLVEEFSTALREAIGCKGRIFLLAGEPGIGKTRAAEEFAAIARSNGAEVHVGRCPESQGAPAFWPWVQLLRSKVQATQVNSLSRALGSESGDIAQIAPEVLASGEDSGGSWDLRREMSPDAAHARFRGFAAIARFWRRASQDQPLMLILDDLHRADMASWRLLQFLAGEVENAPILVLGTYRDTEYFQQRDTLDLVGELTRCPSVRSAQLTGLSLESSEQLLRFCLKRSSSREVVSDLAQRAGGNPFFLLQLVSLASQSRVREADGLVRVRDMPISLQAAVSRHLAHLSGRTRTVLEACSVTGRSFSADLVCKATGGARSSLLRALDEARSARVIEAHDRHTNTYSFSHVLVRDALYDSMPAHRRIHLHLAIGSCIEEQAGAYSEEILLQLAYHFAEASEHGAAQRAVHYMVKSAEAASARLGFEESCARYERALQLCSAMLAYRDEDRCDLEMAYGEALVRAGRREEAKEVFSGAARIAENYAGRDKLARIALRVAPGFLSIETGVYDPFTVALLRRSLDVLPRDCTPLRARALARLAMAVYWTEAWDYRNALVREAEQTAREVDDDYTTVYVEAARCAALWSPKTFEERLQAGPDLVRRAEAAGQDELALLARVFYITTLLEAGEGHELEKKVHDFSIMARQWTGEHPEWYRTLFSAMSSLRSANLSEAVDHANRLLESGIRLSDANVLHSHAAIMGLVHWLQGRSYEFYPAAEKFASSHPNIAAWQCARAFVVQQAGHEERAWEILEQIFHERLLDRTSDMNWLVAAAFVGDTAVELNADDVVAWVYDLLRPFSGRQVVAGFAVVPFGPVDRVLGRLLAAMGRPLEAGREFMRAIDQCRHAKTELWTALTFCDWALSETSRAFAGDGFTAAMRAKRLNSQLKIPRVSEKIAKWECRSHE